MKSFTWNFCVIFARQVFLIAISIGSLSSKVLAEPPKPSEIERLAGSITGEESSLEKFLLPPKKVKLHSSTMNFVSHRTTSIVLALLFVCLIPLINAKAADCCTTDVLETAFIYPTGNLFNSEVWKANRSERFAMLFDLSHRHLKDFSTEDVLCLLGLSEETEARKNKVSAKNPNSTEFFGQIELPSDARSYLRGETQIFYDLGRQKRSKTFLVLTFKNDALQEFQLRQIPNVWSVCTPWQSINLTWEGLAQDYNRKYMIAGMPANLVAQIFPASICSKGAGCSSINAELLLEIQLSPDSATVQRFRVHYETVPGSRKATDWVSKDLRTDNRCLKTASDYLYLRSLSPLFPHDLVFDPMVRFNKKRWKEFLRKPSGIRILMLNDFLRSYPVIGMTRAEIHDLIGRGEVNAYLQSTEVPTDALYCDSEFHMLSVPMGCGNAGTERLQIAYKDNLVCGYRVIYGGQAALEGQRYNLE
jgi:hypothetical protein